MSGQPQPRVWGMAVMPSTLGYSSRDQRVASAFRAMVVASWDEHMLVGTMRTQLRTPALPSGRLKPMKVGLGPCQGGSVGVTSSIESASTWGTSFWVVVELIGSPG